MSTIRFYGLLAGVCIVMAVIVTLLIRHEEPPIRIGVLYSLTGTMAADESPLVDVVQLAVEEINASGGLLGRQVEMLIVDGQSNDAVFAAEAERLISEEKVSVLFACWTSSCRKALKPIVEKHNHLLFYSLQYEGLEQSPNIFYTGATANQQVIPGAHWAIGQFGKHVYLIGSDYIFPHIANLLIKDLVQAESGKVIAEQYRQLGDQDFSVVIDEIQRLQPDMIFNTINGSSNKAFFEALHKAGLQNIPVMSFSVTENGLQEIGVNAYHPQHYATWNYFQSMSGEVNQQFLKKYKTRYGEDRLSNNPVESTYVAVNLWAQGVIDAGVDDPALVKRFLLQHSIAAPSGIAAVDRSTQHLWKQVYIGKARDDFQFDIVWSSKETLRPVPYPQYRTKYEWLELMAEKSGVVQ